MQDDVLCKQAFALERVYVKLEEGGQIFAQMGHLACHVEPVEGAVVRVLRWGSDEVENDIEMSMQRGMR